MEENENRINNIEFNEAKRVKKKKKGSNTALILIISISNTLSWLIYKCF